MLRSESFICDTTDLGEDGLEIGKLYDYDIIILDLMLPDIDGYEVLRRLRAARVRTPILILSGPRRARSQDQGPRLRRRRFPEPSRSTVRELDRPYPGDRATRQGHSESVIRTGKLLGQPRQPGRPKVRRTAAPPDRKEYGILDVLSPAQGHHLTKEMFPQSSLRRHGRGRN